MFGISDTTVYVCLLIQKSGTHVTHIGSVGERGENQFLNRLVHKIRQKVTGAYRSSNLVQGVDPILRDTESLQVAGYIIHILCIYVYAVRVRSKRPKAVTQ